MRRKGRRGHARGISLVVDTNVLSYLFKSDSRGESYRAFLRDELAVISFMTRAELDAWAEIQGWQSSKRARLEQFLDNYATHYPDRDFCRLWAGVMAQARAAGRPIQSADAWIAATALLHGVPLLTNNPGDFAGVPGLKILP